MKFQEHVMVLWSVGMEYFLSTPLVSMGKDYLVHPREEVICIWLVVQKQEVSTAPSLPSLILFLEWAGKQGSLLCVGRSEVAQLCQ